MSNWRTTLVAALAGLGLAVDAIQQAFQAGAFTGKTGTNLSIAICIVLIGAFAKDKQVTGGTIINSTNDATVVKASAGTSVVDSVGTVPTPTPPSVS